MIAFTINFLAATALGGKPDHFFLQTDEHAAVLKQSDAQHLQYVRRAAAELEKLESGSQSRKDAFNKACDILNPDPHAAAKISESFLSNEKPLAAFCEWSLSQLSLSDQGPSPLGDAELGKVETLISNVNDNEKTMHTDFKAAHMAADNEVLGSVARAALTCQKVQEDITNSHYTTKFVDAVIKYLESEDDKHLRAAAKDAGDKCKTKVDDFETAVAEYKERCHQARKWQFQKNEDAVKQVVEELCQDLDVMVGGKNHFENVVDQAKSLM